MHFCSPLSGQDFHCAEGRNPQVDTKLFHTILCSERKKSQFFIWRYVFSAQKISADVANGYTLWSGATPSPSLACT